MGDLKSLLDEPRVSSGGHELQSRRNWSRRMDELASVVSETGSIPNSKHDSLGRFVNNCRIDKARRSHADRTPRMDDLERIPGWTWTKASTAQWNETAQRAADWYALSDARDPSHHASAEEALLARWIYRQRQRNRNGGLDEAEFETLDSMPGWSWVSLNPGIARRSFLERELSWLISTATGIKARPGAVVDHDGTRWDCDIVLDSVNLIVEIDGAWAHENREAIDCQKTSSLMSAGWSVIRLRETPLRSIPCTASVVFPSGGGVLAIADSVLAEIASLGVAVKPLRRDVVSRSLLSEARLGHHDSWYHSYDLLLAYVAEHGSETTTTATVTDTGLNLGAWVQTQRRDHRTGRLSPRKSELLEAIEGWRWKVKTRTGWAEAFARLQKHSESFGTLPSCAHVCSDGMTLGSWISCQRREFRAGRLADEKTTALELVPAWCWVGSSGTRGLPVGCVVDSEATAA
jgi:hypothetical protein